MAITRPGEYQHNNPAYAFVDSNFVRGGGQVVTNVSDLYTIPVDLLKERVTKVWVSTPSVYYNLTDITNHSNSGGWTIETSGGSGTSHFHNQSGSDTVWTITHNLGYYPNVTAQDSAFNIIIGNLNHVSVNQLTLTFSIPVQGTAYLS